MNQHQPRIRLDTPARVLTAIPHLLSHHPAPGTITALIHSRHHVIDTINTPIWTAGEPCPFAPAVTRGACIALAAHGHPDQTTHCLIAAVEAFTRVGYTISHALAVDPDTASYSDLTRNPPWAAHPLPPPDTGIAEAFEATGYRAHPTSRDATEALFHPPAPDALAAAEAAIRAAEHARSPGMSIEQFTQFARRYNDGHSIDPSILGHAVYSLNESAAWNNVLAHIGAPDTAAEALPLLLELTRHTPAAAYRASTAALLAHAAWVTSDYPLARAVVDHALAHDPDHHHAGALHIMLTAGRLSVQPRNKP